MMSGLGEHAVRSVAVDPVTQAMDVAALREAMAADRPPGCRRCWCRRRSVRRPRAPSTRSRRSPRSRRSTARGCTSTRRGPASRPSARSTAGSTTGVEHADSYVTNPHKWLLTTFDCSAFWVRDRSALVGALSILPEYLRNPATESGAVVDYRDWHPQLGRRFRALKLWTVLRTYGLSGLRAHIRQASTRPRGSPTWCAPTSGSRSSPSRCSGWSSSGRSVTTRAHMALMEAVNASGAAYLSHTKVEGRTALRLATGAWQTTDADIDHTWAALVDELDRARLTDATSAHPHQQLAVVAELGVDEVVRDSTKARNEEKPSAFSLNAGFIRCIWLFTPEL